MGQSSRIANTLNRVTKLGHIGTYSQLITVHMAWAATRLVKGAQRAVIRPVSQFRTLGRPHRELSTLDEQEVEKFSKLASLWWDESSPAFGALHRMNSVRVPLVVEAAKQTGQAVAGTVLRPLQDVRVLDIGCGGGILAEGLARAGASVHGIDASAENIAAATAHATVDPDIETRTSYRQVLVEDLADELEHGLTETCGGADAAGKPLFDVVVSSEVIEHVNEPQSFVKAAARCVRPGGAMLMTTIDRSALSYLGAIFAAEQLAGLVPPGTHDYAKLVRPSELKEWMQQAGLNPQKPVPLFYNPLNGQWSMHGSKVAMQYAMIARKAEIV